MDFDLSDDQRALAEAGKKLLADRCTSARVREVCAGGALRVDSDLWGAMAEQGWLALEIPQHLGGLGMGLVEVSVLCEQIGAYLAPVPFAPTVLVLEALSRSVSSGHVDPDSCIGDCSIATWIERLASGTAFGAVAWAADALALRVEEKKLYGRPDPVVYAPVADIVVGIASSQDGWRLVGLAPTLCAAEPTMDVTRSAARPDWSGVDVIEIGAEAQAERFFDRACVLLCAEMLGAAQRVLDMTVQYAKDRVQFGRPIGSFQAVKHRCADMLVDVEGMRSATWYAAWAVQTADEQSQAAACAAKIWCCDASRRTMESGLQVHGGIGFTWDHDLHLYLKRAHLDRMTFGDATWHRRRLASILRFRVESGSPII